MKRYYADFDKYGDESAAALVEAFHSAIKEKVRARFLAYDGDWNAFVFDRDEELQAADFAAIDQRILELGHRYVWSAIVSAEERPEAYTDTEGVDGDIENYSFEHPDAVTAPVDSDGREQRGIGDNVVSYDGPTSGTVRYIRSSATVLSYLQHGVPADTIAVIDDSGGTLTAPILEQFKGVICAGGTVRSHLGILTREYGIPCFMNAKISGIKDGEQIMMETNAIAKTTQAYQQGIEMTAKVWRIKQ